MTKKHKLSTTMKKKIVVLSSIFVALVAGFSGSAVYLNNQHEKKVAAAIPEQRYTTRKIVSTKQTIDADTLKAKTVKVSKLSGPSSSNKGNNIYLMNFDKATDKDKKNASEYMQKHTKDMSVNAEMTFTIADNKKSSVSDGDVNDVDLQGKTLRQYADENHKKLVAVIDTGVNGDYAIKSVNFSNSSTSADKNGHGTDMAKTIQETSNNGAYILSLKAMDDDGTGDMFNVMQAVQYAMNEHVDVINMSITAADDGENSKIFKSVVKQAVDQGIKVVAAAGNYGLDTKNFIPANIEGVVVAGAVDDNGYITDFSNYGLKDQVYVKGATSTSAAAATVTGDLIVNDSLPDNSVLTNVKTTPQQQADRLVSSSDSTKFSVQWADQKLAATVINVKKGDPFRGRVTIGASTSGYPEVSKSIDHNETIGVTFAGLPDVNIAGFARVDVEPGYYADGHIWGSFNQNYNNVSTKSETHLYLDSTGVWTYVPNRGDFVHTDVSFYPKQTIIKFNTAGGSQVASKTLTFNTKDWHDIASLLPKRDGYRFDGFFTSQVGGTMMYGPDGKGQNNNGYWNNDGVWKYNPAHNGDAITVYAHWTLMRFNINFNVSEYPNYPKLDTVHQYYLANGGNANNPPSNNPSTKTATYSQSFTFPDLTANGYTAKWVDSDGNTYNPGQTVEKWSLMGDRTFTAIWTQNTDHDVKLTTTINNSNNTTTINPSTGETLYTVNAITTHNNGTGRTETGYQNSFHKTDAGSDDLITFQRSALHPGYTYGSTGDANDKNPFELYENGNESKEYGASAGGAGAFTTNGTPYVKVRVSHQANSNQELKMNIRGFKYNVYFDRNTGYGPDRKGSIHNDGFRTPLDPQVVTAEGNDETHSYVYGQIDTIDVSYTWKGHTLVGWSTSPDPTNRNAIHYGVNGKSWFFGHAPENYKVTRNDEFNSVAPQSDNSTTVHLYAIWKREDVTVHVDPDGGSTNIGPQKSVHTTRNEEAPGISKWGDHVQLNEPTPQNFVTRVHYNLNDGKMPASHPALDDTAKYEFDHWQIKHSNVNGADLGDSDDLNNGFFWTGTESLTGSGTNIYYAGADDTLIKALYYYSVIKLPEPEKEGYVFLGWYYDNHFMENAGKANENYRVPKSRAGQGGGNTVQLYARWAPISFKYSDMIDTRMENIADDHPNDFSFKIGKFDRAGRTLNGVTIQISTPNANGQFDPNHIVMTLDTSRGLYTSNGKLLTSTRGNDGYYVVKYKDKVSAPLSNGNYVAHEAIAPKGYFYADDYPFNFQAGQNVSIRMNDDKISTDVNFIKNSSEDQDKLIENVKFRLYDLTMDPGCNNIITSATTDKDGKLKLDNNSKELADYFDAGHKYRLREYDAPANFQMKDFDFTIPQKKRDLPQGLGSFQYDPDTSYAILSDSPSKVNLQIEKVDASNHNVKLSGVQVQLYVMKNGYLYPAVKDNKGNLLDPFNDASDYQKYKNNDSNLYKATTGMNGIATFSNLPPKALSKGEKDTAVDVPELEKVKDKNGNLVNQQGKESDWYIKEIKSTKTGNKQYQLLSSPVKITLPDTVKNGETYKVTLYNNHVIEVLQTGGHGATLYTLIGLVLIVAGAAYITRRNKKVA